MASYEVSNRVENIDQINGLEPLCDIYDNYVGKYIVAKSEAEAIKLAIGYIAKQSTANGYKVKIDGDNIKVFDTLGCLVCLYHDFVVRKVDEYTN